MKKSESDLKILKSYLGKIPDNLLWVIILPEEFYHVYRCESTYK